MKNTIKLVMTSIALVSVLAGCQSLATQPTAEPNITGTDVIYFILSTFKTLLISEVFLASSRVKFILEQLVTSYQMVTS